MCSGEYCNSEDFDDGDYEDDGLYQPDEEEISGEQ